MTIRPVTFVAAMLISTSALAHTHMASSVPADGAVLPADAKEVVLVFDGLIAEANCKATDAAGQPAALGAAKPDREKVHVPVAGLAKGAYALTCHYKGADRHEMDATVKFTVAK
jgi:methionine-rich copper-binding protein CopC